MHSVGLSTALVTLPRAVRTAGWLLRLKNRLRYRVAGNIYLSKKTLLPAQKYDFALFVLVSLAQRREYPGLVEVLQLYPYSEVASGRLGKALKEELRSLCQVFVHSWKMASCESEGAFRDPMNYIILSILSCFLRTVI